MGKSVKISASFERENALFVKGFRWIAGIDEVGRGPIAGPVVAAAVILDPHNIPNGLGDSKLISERKRELLYNEILINGYVGIASVPAHEIDQINIRQATLAAMVRAFNSLPLPRHSLRAETFALVDGNDPPPLPCPVETIIKGDAHVASIAAASIIAKVTRDRLMKQLCLSYPTYGFSGHVGYPTPAHKKALVEHGPCPFHRFSFAPLRQAR